MNKLNVIPRTQEDAETTRWYKQIAYAVNSIIDWITNYASNITSLSALTSINGGPLAGLRNRIINGDMRVAQRGTQALINSAAQYGAVDRMICNVNATTVTSGTLTRVTGAATKSTYAVGLYQVSTTGTTDGGFIHRIEALNTADLASKSVTISGIFYQDTGASINVTVQLRKANVKDVFTAVTTIATSAAIPVANGSWVPFQAIIDIGASDASNGLEIFVFFAGLSALSNKSFYLGDFQLEVGSVATPFEQRPYGLEEMLCKRYYQKYTTSDGFYRYFTSAGVYALATIPFPPMRAVPTTIAIPSYTISGVGSAPTISANGSTSLMKLNMTASGAGEGGIQSNVVITIDAEL